VDQPGLAARLRAATEQALKIGSETQRLLDRVAFLEDEVSRLRKAAQPFWWPDFSVEFTNGTASSVNLSQFLRNDQGRSVAYSVASGTLPTGIALSGSALSYNGVASQGSLAQGAGYSHLSFTNLSSGQSITPLVSFWGTQGTGAYTGYGCFGDTSVRRPGKSSSLRMTIKAGSTGRPGDGTAVTDGDFGFGRALPAPVAQGGTVRVGAWVRMPSGFNWLTNVGHTKMLRLEKSAGGKHEVQPLTASWIGGSATAQVGWYPIIEGAGNGQVEAETNFQMATDVRLQPDTWHWVEYYVFVTSVAANAVRRFWVDNVLAFEILGNVIRYRNTGGTYTTAPTWSKAIPTIDAPGDTINNLLWFTYWNGGSPQDQSFYTSDVVFSNNNETAPDLVTDAFGNKMIGRDHLDGAVTTSASVAFLASGGGFDALSSPSNVAIVPNTVVAQVTGLTATPSGAGSITVSWSAAANATGYEVERSPNGLTWTQAVVTSSLSFVNSGLAAGVYFYRVRGTGVTTGAYSASVSAAATAPATSVTVSWTAPTTNTDGSALTGGNAISTYRVSWYKDGYFVNSVRSATSPATITGLSSGTYSFYVTAIAVDNEESDPYLVGTKVVS
jgi:hypothetical protein